MFMSQMPVSKSSTGDLPSVDMLKSGMAAAYNVVVLAADPDVQLFARSSVREDATARSQAIDQADLFGAKYLHEDLRNTSSQYSLIPGQLAATQKLHHAT